MARSHESSPSDVRYASILPRNLHSSVRPAFHNSLPGSSLLCYLNVVHIPALDVTNFIQI